MRPSAVVLVATVRALKHHGGIEDDPRVERVRGLAAIAQRRGQPAPPPRASSAASACPAWWRSTGGPGDTDDEVELVRSLALEGGAVAAEVNDGFARGGEGAAELAEAVADALRAAVGVQAHLRGRRSDRREDQEGREPGVRCEGRGLLPGGRAQDPAVHGGRPRPAADLHGEDAPVALRRPRAAERPGGLHAPGARHPRLHRRRLARAAVRGHPADAGARARRRPP